MDLNLKDKVILVTLGHVGAGNVAMTETINSLKAEHPNLIVVDNLEDAKKLRHDIHIEPEKERGIVINVPEKPFPSKDLKQNALPIINFHEYMPEVKLTHAGEHIKSARNIRREMQRKLKKNRL